MRGGDEEEFLGRLNNLLQVTLIRMSEFTVRPLCLQNSCPLSPDV